MSENQETWKESAKKAVAGEKLTAWYDEAVKKYHVVVDFEFDTTAETTTKAETDSKSEGTKAETEAKTEEVTTAASTEEVTTEAATTADGE